MFVENAILYVVIGVLYVAEFKFTGGHVHKYEALFWPNVNISNFSKEMATILPKLQFQYLIFAKYKIKG